MDDEDVLSTSEVARSLHVTRQTVDRWIRDGKLRARMLRTGERGIYQIRRTDFRDFVRRYVRDDWDRP